MAVLPMPRSPAGVRTAAAAARSRQPGVPDSTVSELEERYKAGREARRIFESDWLLQLAFGLGYQWVSVDPTGRLFNVEIGDDRTMLTDNRIRVASRTNIARLTKAQPTWEGVPRDGSDEEIQRARLREHVFEHYWRELEVRRRVKLALWYREHTGAGFIKGWWDQTAGDSATVMAAKGGPVITDGYGRPITPDRVRQAFTDDQRTALQDTLEERDVTFGDYCVELVTPLELVVDPLATDEGLITAEYVVQDSIISPARLRKLYPNFSGDLPEDAHVGAGTLEGRFPAMSAYLDRSREQRGEAGRRGCRVREYWSMPGVDGPGAAGARHGVYLVHSKELLAEEQQPYEFIPYTMFPGWPAGRFWPDAPVKDLISPQTELNKVESQIAENGERFGNPARLIPAQAQQEGLDWQGLPGEEIVYNYLGDGSAPAFLPGPEMPAYVINRVPQIQESINALSGQFEVAQGTVPQGVTAASAISQLMEATDTMLGPDIADLTDSLMNMGKQLLWCVKKFARNDRLARISGEDSEWDVFSFRGEELGDPTIDELDIASQLTQTKAAKQAAIQFVLNTLIQNGQVPAPRELRRILRDYEVGGLEHMYGSLEKSQAQCVEEHRRLLTGEQLPINTYDDDETHVAEHEDFQRSPKYGALRLKPGGQILQAIVEQHVQLHRDRIQAKVNQAAAAQMIQNTPAGQHPPLSAAALAPGQPAAALPSPAGPSNGA